MKIVINPHFGAFSLSDLAIKWLTERGLTKEQICNLEYPENRANKLLVECVETLKDMANGACASLKVVEYEEQPYYIEVYDGSENVVLSSNFIIPKYKFD